MPIKPIFFNSRAWDVFHGRTFRGIIFRKELGKSFQKEMEALKVLPILEIFYIQHKPDIYGLNS